MPVRFILIVAAIWFLLVIVKRLKLLAQTRQNQKKQAVAHKQVVQCTYCKVYVPKDDALFENGEFFCCAEHMNQKPESGT